MTLTSHSTKPSSFIFLVTALSLQLGCTGGDSSIVSADGDIISDVDADATDAVAACDPHTAVVQFIVGHEVDGSCVELLVSSNLWENVLEEIDAEFPVAAYLYPTTEGCGTHWRGNLDNALIAGQGAGSVNFVDIDGERHVSVNVELEFPDGADTRQQVEIHGQAPMAVCDTGSP